MMLRKVKRSYHNKKVAYYLRLTGYSTILGKPIIGPWVPTTKEVYNTYKDTYINSKNMENMLRCESQKEIVYKYITRDNNSVPPEYLEDWKTFSGIEPRYILSKSGISIRNFFTAGDIPTMKGEYIGKIIANCKVLGLLTNKNFKASPKELQNSSNYTNVNKEVVVPEPDFIAKIHTMRKNFVTAVTESPANLERACADLLSNIAQLRSHVVMTEYEVDTWNKQLSAVENKIKSIKLLAVLKLALQ